MDSQRWIESLARKARMETPPAMALSDAAIDATRSPLRRWPSARPLLLRLWLSAGASVAVAGVVLALGLHSASAGTTSSTRQHAQTASVDPMSALFSPLEVTSNDAN